MFSNDLEKGFKGMFASNRARRVEEIVKEATSPAPPPATESSDNDATPAPKSTRRAKADPPDTERRRVIRREWPRDPKGPVMKQQPYGKWKMAANNLPIWGATILDFYRTQRIPDCPYVSTITCGGKMLAFVQEVGELEHAKDEIAWAKEEAEPVEILPYDAVSALNSGAHGLWTPDPPASALVSKPFHRRIPFHLLPEKLIVHDPDIRLPADGVKAELSNRSKTQRVYKLQLSPAVRDAVAAKRQEIATGPKKQPPDIVFVTNPTDNRLSKYTAPLEEGEVPEATSVKLPPYPDEALSIPEAHLYISAYNHLGDGNHSYVYRADLELPRSLFVGPSMCDECSHRAILKHLQAEMPNVETNPEDPLAIQIEDLLMAIGSEHKRKGRVWTETKVRPGRRCLFQAGNERNPELDKVFTLDKGGCISRNCYEGTMRNIQIEGLKWSTPGDYCEHEAARQAAPTTFKVQVAAKLSIQHDQHLRREARNYQMFPEHFFQHWSGYNVLPPLHDPTPATAVVPQFYGYYVPEDGEKADGDDPYLSPILLVEDCGTPVEIEKLGIDDRQDCAALIFRMHCEGWLHGSVAPRNVVVDYGDIHDPPEFTRELEGGKDKRKRFRLIDFGRSEHDESSAFRNKRATEEWEVQTLFKVANGRFI